MVYSYPPVNSIDTSIQKIRNPRRDMQKILSRFHEMLSSGNEIASCAYEMGIFCMSLRGLRKKTRTPSETNSPTSLIITGFTAATNRLTYLVESAMLIPTLIRPSMRINKIRCSCAAVINLRHHEHSTLQCRCGLAAGTADRLMSGYLVVCSLFCDCLVVPLFM